MPKSHYDSQRNDWVCDKCGEVTDLCECGEDPPVYEVIVGNVGSVYRGKDEATARRAFAEYVEQSKSQVGRAGCEDVLLLVNGEVEAEHLGLPDVPEEPGDN